MRVLSRAADYRHAERLLLGFGLSLGWDGADCRLRLDDQPRRKLRKLGIR